MPEAKKIINDLIKTQGSLWSLSVDFLTLRVSTQFQLKIIIYINLKVQFFDVQIKLSKLFTEQMV